MCWHKWTKWSTPVAVKYYDGWMDAYGYDYDQHKTCLKCGKVKVRTVER
jgi:hypothetical protein